MKPPSYGYRPSSYQQPGLEVVPQEKLEYLGLEVVPRTQELDKYLSPHQETQAAAEIIPSIAKGRSPNTRILLKRKHLWIFLGVLAAIIVVGAVVGGVVGSKATQRHQEAKDAEDGPKPSSNNATTAPLKSIARGSDLAVTGWRKRNGVEIYLSYQGPDDKLRFSKYDSGRGTFTVNNSYWEDPTYLTNLTSSAGPGSRIAGATVLWQSKFAPQVEFFYVNADNRVFGVNLNPTRKPTIEDDSININASLTTGTSGNVAAYWPYVVFQDSGGELTAAKNTPADIDALFPASDWEIRKLGVKGAEGTKLAVIPLSTNYSKIADQGGYGVIYQRNDGRLFAVIPDLDSMTSNYTSSWPTSDFPSISIPKGNSLAAFATARDGDDKQRVNTYLLYQDSDNRINMVWIDDDTSWKTATPAALEGADQASDIACLTMPTTFQDINFHELQLEQASSETRCYFQRGGIVQEVVLSGTDWVEIGSVPMP